MPNCCGSATGLDQKSQHYIASIVDSALAAGRPVDDCCASRTDGPEPAMGRVDMKLMAESGARRARESGAPSIGDPAAAGLGDAAAAPCCSTHRQRRQTLGRDPAVTVEGRDAGTRPRSRRRQWRWLDMAYVGKLSGVFHVCTKPRSSRAWASASP
jgi:hypothetical protein